MTGVVLRARGGVYEVETEEGVFEAVLRGRLKRDERTGDRVVAGDRVEIAGGSGREGWTIETVHDRRSALVRRAPGKAPRPKVIAANVDRVVIVFAAAHPDPHLRMLDRFLVLCESSELDALVVVNKVDLVGDEKAREVFGVYEEIGYPVLYTSAARERGIVELRESIRGAICVFTGPSGVGKSSLLNEIQPGLGLRVGSVSETVRKGRHTTVTAELIRLDCGGYVVDTPGLRELGLWEVEPSELHHYFPEFREYLGTCRYGNSCTHSHEPGCAVQAAVDRGAIHRQRYESYLRMLAPEDDAAEW
jgi:ribosome biogenesis GTPase / thiamine phosphate phosphatase